MAIQLTLLTPSSNNNSFNQLLPNYKIFFQSDSNPNTYVIAEDHHDEKCRKQNGELISYLARRSSYPLILLIEGTPSMEKIEDKAAFFKSTFHIDKDVHHKIELYGWDADKKTLEDVGRSDKATLLLTKQLIQLYQENDSITQLANQVIDKYNNNPSLENWANATPLLDSMSNLSKKIKSQITELEKLKEEHQKDLGGPPITEETLSRTFPKRTLCQKNTLEAIRKQREQNLIKGDVVLVCGLNHAKTLERHKTDRNYNLDLFYEELKNYNAMVLIPKIIDRD